MERDALVQDLVARAVERPSLSHVFLEFYRRVLVVAYREVQDHLDVPGWARTQGDGLTDAAAVAERFAFLGKRRVATLRRAAEASAGAALLSPSFPAFSDLVGRAIDRLYKVENLEDRFAVCLFFLKDQTLGYRQKDVIVDLLGVVKQLMDPDRHMDAERVLTRLTAFFRGRDNEFLLMRFQCYEAIGVAIGEAGNVRAADHLIEDILYWKFQYPDIRGATDEWETVVNPFHLPKIRCWMHIIESNPALFERLAAALNVQLRLGGVYIADTDLFQRDVTRFLNADIRPIYFVAKQLLRTLPVYFGDVGAEGELRSVSTQIDEICGRRDTLMHFLRKQAHAESSNRLVAFSRAVLHYWMTLEPAVLEPFLSANTMAMVRGELEWAQGPHDVLFGLERRLAVAQPAAAPAKRAGRRRKRLAADAPPLPRLWTTSSTGCSRCPHRTSRRTWRTWRGATARTARPGQTRTGGAWRCSRGRSSCSPRSTRCRPTTWGRRSAVTCSSRPRVRERFGRALAAWQARPAPRTRDRLLDAALTVLEELKTIVLSPSPSTATENIYQKRHIAAGIPSIYGNYSEPKFDALGLSFRVENLVGQAARGPGRGRHGALRDARLPAPHGDRDQAVRAGARRGRRGLARPRRQPEHARGQLQHATTSPSTSTRTCSSSWCRASPSSPRCPCSATSRCCTRC